MIRSQWLRRSVSGAPVFALALSASMNVGLVMKLGAVEERSRPGLHIGDAVPAILSTLPASKLKADAKPTLVYHFSASCGWCERNWSNVVALANQTQGRLRVVAVSIAPLPSGFQAARNLSIEIVDNLPASTVAAYKLAATPQTILIGADGRVAESWFGAYSGSFAKQLESFFRVRLPGLETRRAADHAR